MNRPTIRMFPSRLKRLVKQRLLEPLRRARWQRDLARWPATADGRRLLHIGCGEVVGKDFINLDARPFPHVHIVSRNLFRLQRIPDRSLDMVYMCHVLEHVPRSQIIPTLREMARVLKPGGILRLSVPDFDLLLALYEASGQDLRAIAPALMGGQDYPFNFHYAVFNRAALAEALAASGLSDIHEWFPHACEFHDFEDWASRRIEHQGRDFPISLNLEAVRNA